MCCYQPIRRIDRFFVSMSGEPKIVPAYSERKRCHRNRSKVIKYLTLMSAILIPFDFYLSLDWLEHGRLPHRLRSYGSGFGTLCPYQLIDESVIYHDVGHVFTVCIRSHASHTHTHQSCASVTQFQALAGHALFKIRCHTEA